MYQFQRLAFNCLLSLSCLLCGTLLQSNENSGGEAMSSTVEVEFVEQIWSKADHNAFTDLIRYKNQWVVTFREAGHHTQTSGGKICLLVSDAGRQWQSAALLAYDHLDLRDPHLSIAPDGQLMLLMGCLEVTEEDKYEGLHTRVSMTDDFTQWPVPEPVYDPGEWIWKLTWHEGVGYGISYSFDGPPTEKETTWYAKLVKTTDGKQFQLVTDLGIPDAPSEGSIGFLPDNRMVAVIRRGKGDRMSWYGESLPPYTDWKWNSCGQTLHAPDLLVATPGTCWVSGREVEFLKEKPETMADLRCWVSVGKIVNSQYEPLVTLPSGGDCGYTGMVLDESGGDRALWISYYSEHECKEDKTAIYIAKIRL